MSNIVSEKITGIRKFSETKKNYNVGMKYIKNKNNRNILNLYCAKLVGFLNFICLLIILQKPEV